MGDLIVPQLVGKFFQFVFILTLNSQGSSGKEVLLHNCQQNGGSLVTARCVGVE